MALTIYQVDSFSEKPFGGNPAGVCVLPEPRGAEWMQLVAAEMNVAETAFLGKREDGYDLRWFTPAVEVDLCGHATLASAHVLWETGEAPSDAELRFHTRSGILSARRAHGRIELNFPAEPAKPCTPPGGLLDALGTEASFVGKNRMDYLVEVASESALRALAPNHRALIKLTDRGVIATARSDSSTYDFVSRFFAPAAGIDEDPVTGSAHCCLGPYWAGLLNKAEFTAYQASKRGGVVHVRVDGDRVHLGGHAVTVLRAELLA